MNLTQLEYFVSTVKHGSYAQAAKSLYITPQAASKAISDLEKELHVELFAKAGRGVIPTTKGMLVAEKAQQIVETCEDFKSYVRTLVLGDINDELIEGSISIAICSSPYEGGIFDHEHLLGFQKKYPGIIMTQKYSSSGVCLSALQESVVDSAIIVGKSKISGIQSIKLGVIKQKVLMSHTHPLAKRKYIKYRDLKNYHIAQPYDLRYCYPQLLSRFNNLRITPMFEHVQPIVSAYQKFLTEKHGVFFASHSNALQKLYPEAVFVDLHPYDAIEWPLYFVYFEDNTSIAIDLMQKYLIHQNFDFDN